MRFNSKSINKVNKNISFSFQKATVRTLLNLQVILLHLPEIQVIIKMILLHLRHLYLDNL